MELPSVKLNIFKKLEYFLILKELNKQFDDQLNILKLRKYNKEDKKFENSAYPIWEIEKKVLYWTYAYHKFINQRIKSSHFKDMFISEDESKYVGGQYNIFGNLKRRGFAETSEDGLECTITKEGLAFGELLWYLYKPEKHEVEEVIKPKSYQDIYKTDFRLSRKSIGLAILQLQLISVYIITVYAIALFALEILERMGLINNLRNLVIDMPLVSSDIFWIILVIIPFVIFAGSFLGDFVYKWFVVGRRHKYVEELKNLNLTTS